MDTYDDDGFIIDANALVAYNGDEEHVVIPDGVMVIQEGAFSDNDRMRTVDLNEVSHISSNAFKDCSALETVFVHESLELIRNHAFVGCCSLKAIRCARGEKRPADLILEDEAFAGCTSLESFDLFNMPRRIVVGDRCFSGCTALKAVYFGKSLVLIGDDIFEGCTVLNHISLEDSASYYSDPDYECVLQTIKDSYPRALELRSPLPHLRKALVPDPRETEEDPLPWSTGNHERNVRSLTYHECTDQLADHDTAGLFLGYSSLERIDLTGLDTSGATDLRQMFLCCRSLRSLDLSCLDTSQVESMAHLAHNCHALKQVNLSGLDLSRVKSLWSAFDSCESLVDIDLSEQRTPALEKVGYMFRGCKSLRRANLRDMDFSQVKSLSHLFCGCKRLREADLAGTDLHSVTKMTSAFEGCASLTELDLSGLKDACVRTMDRCFEGCSSLTGLDLSGITIDIRYEDYVLRWFKGCSSLKTLRLPEVRDSRGRKDFHQLFDGCDSLECWEAPASWPVNRVDAIPEPTAECGMWWSVRSHRWMTVEQIRQRGPVADIYASEPRTEVC